jgi:putative Holliday junction resolvase
MNPINHGSDKILAIDYGTKRIGVAVSDALGMLAHPRGIIENGPKMLDNILALIAREEVKKVIIGIPRTLSNSDSEMTKQVIAFRDKLAARLDPLGIPVESRDERLTSIMAETNIRSRELPRNRRHEKGLRDEEAARILLQEYLDSNRS